MTKDRFSAKDSVVREAIREGALSRIVVQCSPHGITDKRFACPDAAAMAKRIAMALNDDEAAPEPMGPRQPIELMEDVAQLLQALDGAVLPPAAAAIRDRLNMRRPIIGAEWVSRAPAAPQHIVVVMENDAVSHVLAVHPVAVTVLDYVVEGSDEPVFVIPQGDGRSEPALRWTDQAEVNPERVHVIMGAPVDDDGCPKGDPDCEGGNGDCHDACEGFAERFAKRGEEA